MKHNKINKTKKNIKSNFDILYQDSLKAFKNNEVPVSALIYDPKKKKIISYSLINNLKSPDQLDCYQGLNQSLFLQSM